MKTVIVLLILSFVALCYSFPFTRGAGGRGGGMNFAALMAAMDLMELQEAMALTTMMRRHGTGKRGAAGARRSPLNSMLHAEMMRDPPDIFRDMAAFGMGFGGMGMGGMGRAAGKPAAGK